MSARSKKTNKGKPLNGVREVGAKVASFDLEKTGKSLLYLGIGSAVLVGLAYGAYWFLSNKIQEAQTANAEEDVFSNLSPENFAQRLRLSFYDGSQWMAYGGTDEEAILKVFDEIPTQSFYARVVDAYSNLYPSESLTADLESELKDSPDVYAQIQEKMSNKPR